MEITSNRSRLQHKDQEGEPYINLYYAVLDEPFRNTRTYTHTGEQIKSAGIISPIPIVYTRAHLNLLSLFICERERAHVYGYASFPEVNEEEEEIRRIDSIFQSAERARFSSDGSSRKAEWRRFLLFSFSRQREMRGRDVEK